MIDISKLNKAEVLAALYNRSRSLGLGHLQFRPEDMTTEQAEELLQGQTYFDYLYGRVIKISLKGDSFEERLYDRDNGPGAAMAAIKHLEKKP